MGDLPLRTPRHRSLGGPLPRQLANVTHAHPLPPQLLWLYHAVVPSYGVLIRLSTGYPPVKGRLHTRYSPVRRSSPDCSGLPLDLHVLSLPLAFILSQDQTLRCIENFKYYSVLTRLFSTYLLTSYLSLSFVVRLLSFSISSMNLFIYSLIHPNFPAKVRQR